MGGQIAPVLPVVGARRWGFLGDSITNGSTASNANLAFTNQLMDLLGGGGSARLGKGSVVSGHPGFRSDQIAPFLASDLLSAKCDTIVFLEGTNDIGQGVSVATYAANMLAQFRAAKQLGKRVFILTPPPRGSNATPTTAQDAATDAYNLWLRLVGPQYGQLVDLHKAFAVSTTGRLNASYDSGDGIHPNSLGHWTIASLLATAALANVPAISTPPQLINGVSTLNILTNPYFFTGTSGWFEQPGGTGAAPTYTRPSDATGFVTTGNFLEMDFDGTSGTGSRTYATAVNSSSWSVGDTLAITGKVQLFDSSGNWTTVGPGAAGTAGVSVKIVDQSGVTVTGGPAPITGLGRSMGSSLYNWGPFYETLTVPAGVTGMNLWCTLNLPTGSHFKMRLAEMGVINLTTSGLLNAPLSA